MSLIDSLVWLQKKGYEASVYIIQEHVLEVDNVKGISVHVSLAIGLLLLLLLFPFWATYIIFGGKE